MKNEEILHGFKEERNILLTIKEGRLTALVTLCRNCFRTHALKRKMDVNIDVTARRGKKIVSSKWMTLR